MRVWRGITLSLWVILMSTCVGIIALYYVLSQTALSPTAAKRWLDQSGSYTTLAEIVVPSLADSNQVSSERFLTPEMVKRAANASIKPQDVKAKTEPIVDAVYGWLDNKSPEVSFTVPIDSEVNRFLQALQKEVNTKVNSLPQCRGYVDPSEIEQANCLPSYVSAETAVDTVMTKVKQQAPFRDKQLTPESFTGKVPTPSHRIPDLLSLLWVIQLIAIPLAIVVALFVVIKRKGVGVFALGLSLFLPGLALLVAGMLVRISGDTAIASWVGGGDFAAIAGSLGKVVAASIANTSLLAGGGLTAIGVALGSLGLWWWRRQKASN